ncbi:sulfurtransferase [Mastigocoleus testarum]|uniref:thiosulfate sulfurtransferase n=1 Tax=Mastigocoleus testarum BC008 TaxID=371196 RepID=A0A0V7ZJ58_9CYAN|nr:sulfurtransferase [Mastigocoleus testarum]KST64536.1 thiosulfate sulfurtransferase [Mastigocoleus testarum BC008]
MDIKTLITPKELSVLLEQQKSNLIVIDTRSQEEYAISHIQGSINLRDIFTYLADSTSQGSEHLHVHFANLLGAAGISGKESIIIYEDAMNTGYGQSCRGYFLLKYLGCQNVAVLHGGWKAWLGAGFSTTAEVPKYETKEFVLNINSSIMATTEEMLQILEDPKIIKLDVRDVDEWIGTSSSPYGVDFCPRKGRIPGAVWIDWHRMMKNDSEIPMFKCSEEVRKIAEEVGITSESNVYVYCFKGSRAANTMIALNEAGITNVHNYFASWNEWSRNPSLPIDSRVFNE